MDNEIKIQIELPSDIHHFISKLCEAINIEVKEYYRNLFLDALRAALETIDENAFLIDLKAKEYIDRLKDLQKPLT